MSRAPLTPDDMDEALALFLLQLSIATFVNPYDFAEWIRANLDWLRPHFAQSDEPKNSDPRVENVQAVWLRAQFVERRRVKA